MAKGGVPGGPGTQQGHPEPDPVGDSDGELREVGGRGKGKEGGRHDPGTGGGWGAPWSPPRAPRSGSRAPPPPPLCCLRPRLCLRAGSPRRAWGVPGTPGQAARGHGRKFKKKKHRQNHILSIFIEGEMDASGRRRSRGEPGSSGAARGELFPQPSRSCIIRPHGQRRQVGGGGLLGGCGHWPGGHGTPKGLCGQWWRGSGGRTPSRHRWAAPSSA